MSAASADVLVFYGATGDLAFKKIFPALQRLTAVGALEMPVIGVAKSGTTLPDRVTRARESVVKHRGGVDEAAFAKLVSRLRSPPSRVEPALPATPSPGTIRSQAWS